MEIELVSLSIEYSTSSSIEYSRSIVKYEHEFRFKSVTKVLLTHRPYPTEESILLAPSEGIPMFVVFSCLI